MNRRNGKVISIANDSGDPTPKFKPGDVVRHIVSKECAMVLEVDHQRSIGAGQTVYILSTGLTNPILAGEMVLTMVCPAGDEFDAVRDSKIDAVRGDRAGE